MTPDPFPRQRLGTTLHRLPAYGRLAFGLAMDPKLDKGRRAAVVAAAGYLISPLDLVPGVIPVLGQLDHLAVAFAALQFALAGLDAGRRQEHLARVGLADAALTEDLATMGALTVWTVRAGARTTRRVAVRGSQAAASGVRAAGAAAAAGAAWVGPRLREAAEPIARRATRATPDAVKHAGPRAGLAARETADRLTPLARTAATRIGSAAGDASSRGVSLVRGRMRRVGVSVPKRLVLEAPAEERLEVESDDLDPGPARG